MNLVTIKDVSAFLKVKPATMYSWVHNGTIPFIKLNGLLRFDMDEITKWVESSKPVPPNIPKTLKKSANMDIDAIVKRAVASTRKGSYNPAKRETSLSQGLGKEDQDGTL
jgi:excisionase family DNA binding protein